MESHPPNTLRLKMRSSSPALLVATQVYLALSEGRALDTVSTVPSGLLLHNKQESHNRHVQDWRLENTPCQWQIAFSTLAGKRSI